MSDLCQKRTLRMTPKKGFNGESECDLLSKDPVSILLASVFFPQELFLTLSKRLCPMSDLCQMRTLRMTPKIGFNGKSEFDLLSKDPFSILLASVFFPQELFLTLSKRLCPMSDLCQMRTLRMTPKKVFSSKSEFKLLSK